MRTKLGLFLILLCAFAVFAQHAGSPLTNADVIKMVKAGKPEAFILNAIAASDTQFDLSSTGLQALSQAGVGSKVIRAMLAAQAKKQPPPEAAAPSDANAAVPSPQEDVSPSQSASPMGTGMPPEMMAQMQNLPPAARAQMEAAMAQRGARRGGGGGAPANAARSIPSRQGVPIPLDGALYTSFTRLKARSSYHVFMNMQSNDPKVAQMMAQGTVTPAELIVQGNTRQYSMHMKIPARDEPGTIDDWEIRAVVQNGRAARLLTSPAVPRILKKSEEKAAMGLAMLDQQAATAIARAAAEGPMGAIGAGMMAAQTALTHAEMPKMLKKERDMFSWKCSPAPKNGGPGQASTTQLTDFHAIGDQNVDGRIADGYEFYAYDNEKTQGTVHLFVAKHTGLPLRIEMGDPNAGGGLQMNYGELTAPVNIEIPACMGCQ
jgi:hypothetical protein